MTKKEIPLVSWGWSEGRVWDNWMLVHFLSGIVVASVLALAGASASYASIIALVVLTLWEFAEMAVGVQEEVENIVLDIIAGMLGFFIFSEYIRPLVAVEMLGWVTLSLFVITCLGSLLGWRAYAKRKQGDK